MLDFDTEWATGAEGTHLEHADRSRSAMEACQSSWNFIQQSIWLPFQKSLSYTVNTSSSINKPMAAGNC